VTTTRDIATRLNLSVSTVGRALSDDPRISAETKLRVNRMASELGYVGNRAARMMRGARSTVIGLVVPDVGNTFYSTVAHALADTVSRHDHQVMLCETGDDRQNELHQIRDLAAAQVAGVVIVPTAKPHPDVPRLLRSIPHVQLLRKVSGLSQDWFGIDDHTVVHKATSHLLAQGHRRLAYIGGTTDLPTAEARCAGFRDAIAAARLPKSSAITELGSPSAVSHGADSLRRLMALSNPPTAIVTGSIQVTRGVLAAAHEDGTRVPGQVSLVGFGDELGFSWWGPGLTTVALPMHDIATACGVWLLHRLTLSPTEAAQATPFTSVSPGELVQRGSTAPPPSAPKGSRARNGNRRSAAHG
jgi:DNA-binding LacI/PurR family transcriptional regulator